MKKRDTSSTPNDSLRKRAEMLLEKDPSALHNLIAPLAAAVGL